MKIKDFVPPIIFKIINRFSSQNNFNFINSYNGEVVFSHSQYGEDLAIDAILGMKSDGFYIDIGANDPTKLSNTKRFYDKGWRGINIEPNPVLFKQFEKQRNNDINLNIGIGSNEDVLDFFELSLDVLSTFNKKVAMKIDSTSKIKIIKEYKVAVKPLQKIYADYVRDKHVDFLSIDTEGFEMEVLNGNDWNVNRPTLIIIEMGENHDKIFEFLTSINYKPVYFNNVNAIFVDN